MERSGANPDLFAFGWLDFALKSIPSERSNSR
jgi:hypothetical protein